MLLDSWINFVIIIYFTIAIIGVNYEQSNQRINVRTLDSESNEGLGI